MSEQGINWQSRLRLRVTGGDVNVDIPIIDATPSINSPHTNLYSSNSREPVGTVSGNLEYPITISCYAIKNENSGINPAKELTILQKTDQKCNITIVEEVLEGQVGNQFMAEESILFENVYIDSNTPATITNDGSAPVARFAARAERAYIDGI